MNFEKRKTILETSPPTRHNYKKVILSQFFIRKTIGQFSVSHQTVIGLVNFQKVFRYDSNCQRINILQGRNHSENVGATTPMVGRICPPPGWNRVKISENVGATAVGPVTPVDTSQNL